MSGWNLNEFSGHKYAAISDAGEYVREARTIGELPTPEVRKRAIEKAKSVLGLEVNFGCKIAHSNNLSRTEVKRDSTGLLVLRGCELPLSIFHSTNQNG